ncbi:VWA domain-containing protein [Motiliproteus sp. MSK22-1]|uniref:vWA domain-containing protein n=1 Tax=Motiliproteus sp. MSK22-1 TaxID=1897630 RepID=UPI0009753922|nr:VWA domain-containing protein [Motiliproteus sp. MSK22-1]OMH33680.1 BatB protein [Motiliproteus sp. MSK22-1]
MLTVEWPWLLLLLPLPWLIQRFIPPAPRQEAALMVPFFDAIDNSKAAESKRLVRRRLPGVILWLIWILVLVAASRPLWVGEPVPLASSGRDLMLAVDLSGSMKEEDMELDGVLVNRLTAVKKVLGEFAERRQGDRLGLILFGSQAYLHTPLTFDHKTLALLLDEAQIGFAGEETAIGDAIGLSIKRLQERPAESRVLVLLTDGANTAGRVEPIEAAKMAAQENIRIYTLGFGAEEMLVRSFFGTRRINPSADLDEASLQSIAETTSGRYFRARDIKELENIYQTLDRLEPVPQADEMIRPQQTLFHWPLGVAFILSLFWGVIRLPALGFLNNSLDRAYRPESRESEEGI